MYDISRNHNSKNATNTSSEEKTGNRSSFRQFLMENDDSRSDYTLIDSVAPSVHTDKSFDADFDSALVHDG